MKTITIFSLFSGFFFFLLHLARSHKRLSLPTAALRTAPIRSSKTHNKLHGKRLGLSKKVLAAFLSDIANGKTICTNAVLTSKWHISRLELGPSKKFFFFFFSKTVRRHPAIDCAVTLAKQDENGN